MVRKCSVTNEIMTEGWCACDGEKYFRYKHHAIRWCLTNGYKSFDEAFDDEAIYWSTWDDEAAHVQLAEFRSAVIKHVLEQLSDDVVVEHIQYGHTPKQLFYDIWKPNL